MPCPPEADLHGTGRGGPFDPTLCACACPPPSLGLPPVSCFSRPPMESQTAPDAWLSLCLPLSLPSPTRDRTPYLSARRLLLSVLMAGHRAGAGAGGHPFCRYRCLTAGHDTRRYDRPLSGYLFALLAYSMIIEAHRRCLPLKLGVALVINCTQDADARYSLPCKYGSIR